MKQHSYALITLLFMMVTATTLAQNNPEQESPIWLSDVVDPSGKAHTFSLENILFNQLQSNLDFGFQLVQANSRRSQFLLNNNKNACAGNKLKTQQRVAKYPMSALPQTLFLGQRVYFTDPGLTDRMKQAQNDSGQITITTLLQVNPDLIMGIQDGRSYGDRLDNVFQQIKDKVFIYRRNDFGTSQGIVDMLLAKRVSFIIEYPNVLEHYRHTSTEHSATLYSYPVAELDRYHPGYIMCSPGEIGQKLILQLNAAIAAASKQRAYLDAHLAWYEPNSHAEMLALYNHIYGTSFTLQ